MSPDLKGTLVLAAIFFGAWGFLTLRDRWRAAGRDIDRRIAEADRWHPSQGPRALPGVGYYRPGGVIYRDPALPEFEAGIPPEPEYRADVERVVATAIGLTREEPIGDRVERWLRGQA